MAVNCEISEDGKQVNITVTGRFDFNDHQDFRSAYEKTGGKGTTYIVDMVDTEYLDSSALGMLLLMREFAGGDQAKILLKNCQPSVKQILKVANFAKLFTLA